MASAPQIPVTAQTVVYPLARANEALDDLRHGRIDGAAVLIPESSVPIASLAANGGID